MFCKSTDMNDTKYTATLKVSMPRVHSELSSSGLEKFCAAFLKAQRYKSWNVIFMIIWWIFITFIHSGKFGLLRGFFIRREISRRRDQVVYSHPHFVVFFFKYVHFKDRVAHIKSNEQLAAQKDGMRSPETNSFKHPAAHFSINLF